MLLPLLNVQVQKTEQSGILQSVIKKIACNTAARSVELLIARCGGVCITPECTDKCEGVFLLSW